MQTVCQMQCALECRATQEKIHYQWSCSGWVLKAYVDSRQHLAPFLCHPFQPCRVTQSGSLSNPTNFYLSDSI